MNDTAAAPKAQFSLNVVTLSFLSLTLALMLTMKEPYKVDWLGYIVSVLSGVGYIYSTLGLRPHM